LSRAYYHAKVADFIRTPVPDVLGQLTQQHVFSLEDLQRNAWVEEIQILKRELAPFPQAEVIFEYSIPRVGGRIDVVVLHAGIVFVLEFKVGESDHHRSAADQVMDYALDLKNFHKESHQRIIAPLLVATKSKRASASYSLAPDGIFEVVHSHANALQRQISEIINRHSVEFIEPEKWINSIYMPTPTIIEAAQVMYRGHNVREITQHEAGTNLDQTALAVLKIIDDSRRNQKKSICLITGVPGAGKTLAGLNIANQIHNFELTQHAVFLSGNQPLVDVLQEALARDSARESKIKKRDSMHKVKSFIQIIHHYRDDAIAVEAPPFENIAIFDEAQRAWDESSLTSFMTRKKGVRNFNQSEPEFLISILDRHPDWAVIVCLIGGGQEINTGEAGISEWFRAVKKQYRHWDLYLSSHLNDSEYLGDQDLEHLLRGINHQYINDLHLAIPLRSFRSEKMAAFVKSLLDLQTDESQQLYRDLKSNYPIVMTRDLEQAKTWIRTKARGTERYGLTASSGAKRLRNFGVWVQSKIDAPTWFLNDKDDIRSSYFLEETATEFDIQGLELDWTIVCWDADLRFEHNQFQHYNFAGTKWQRVKIEQRRMYLKNTYRVLLTRARQGLVIFIPHGDEKDRTRLPEFYDGTYQYLKSIGIDEI